MLGSVDDRDDRERFEERRASARSAILSAPARREGTSSTGTRREKPLRAGNNNDESTTSFANFASFSDDVPVVPSWNSAASSSALHLEGDRDDPGDFSDGGTTLEAMLEAQVASLDGGSADKLGDWPE